MPRHLNVTLGQEWASTALYPNPFKDDGRNIKFVALSFLDQTIPALFDTGADLNVMSWNEERYPVLSKLRKKLRTDWEYQGAIGVFTPKAKIRIERLTSGSLSWRNKNFVAMELPNLGVLGAEGHAFGVVGMDLWPQDEIYMDFHKDFVSARIPNRLRERPFIAGGLGVVHLDR